MVSEITAVAGDVTSERSLSLAYPKTDDTTDSSFEKRLEKAQEKQAWESSFMPNIMGFPLFSMNFLYQDIAQTMSDLTDQGPRAHPAYGGTGSNSEQEHGSHEPLRITNYALRITDSSTTPQHPNTPTPQPSTPKTASLQHVLQWIPVPGQATSVLQRIFEMSRSRVSQVMDVDMDFLVEQAINRLRVTKMGETTELTLGLKPEHLGEMVLSLSRTPQGVMIHIQALPEARAILEKEMKNLQLALESAGVITNSLKVSALMESRKGRNNGNHA